MTLTCWDRFYGITSLQTFFYFSNYSRDRLLYRVSVRLEHLSYVYVSLNADLSTEIRSFCYGKFKFETPSPPSVHLSRRILDTVHTCLVVFLLYHYTIILPKGTVFVPDW